MASALRITEDHVVHRIPASVMLMSIAFCAGCTEPCRPCAVEEKTMTLWLFFLPERQQLALARCRLVEGSLRVR